MALNEAEPEAVHTSCCTGDNVRITGRNMKAGHTISTEDCKTNYCYPGTFEIEYLAATYLLVHKQVQALELQQTTDIQRSDLNTLSVAQLGFTYEKANMLGNGDLSELPWQCRFEHFHGTFGEFLALAPLSQQPRPMETTWKVLFRQDTGRIPPYIPE